MSVIPFQAFTTKDRVADLIRQSIFAGEIRPGERIVELHWAKRLGIGTTSVREALFQLEREGFVVRVAHKGTRVIQLSPEDTRQIYRVRKELEGLAVELLTPRLDEAAISDLQQILHQMGAAAADRDLPKFYAMDLSFHKKLWHFSGNKYITQFLEGVVVPLFAFYIIQTTLDRERLLAETKVHQGILDAIRAGDAKHARQVMEQTLEYYSREESRFLGIQDS